MRYQLGGMRYHVELRSRDFCASIASVRKEVFAAGALPVFRFLLSLLAVITGFYQVFTKLTREDNDTSPAGVRNLLEHTDKEDLHAPSGPAVTG